MIIRGLATRQEKLPAQAAAGAARPLGNPMLVFRQADFMFWAWTWVKH
jgi:hypothetical protein